MPRSAARLFAADVLSTGFQDGEFFFSHYLLFSGGDWGGHGRFGGARDGFLGGDCKGGMIFCQARGVRLRISRMETIADGCIFELLVMAALCAVVVLRK